MAFLSVCLLSARLRDLCASSALSSFMLETTSPPTKMKSVVISCLASSSLRASPTDRHSEACTTSTCKVELFFRDHLEDLNVQVLISLSFVEFELLVTLSTYSI